MTNGIADPNFTQHNSQDISAGGRLSAWKYEAQVVAAVAGANPLAGGFLKAGDTYHILNKGWIRLPNNGGCILTTSTVAANCWANFSWLEMLD